MNKEQLIHLNFLCKKLGPTANALIAITDFPNIDDSERMNEENRKILMGGTCRILEIGEVTRPMTEEEKLTKILEVLEEAYKTIKEKE